MDKIRIYIYNWIKSVVHVGNRKFDGHDFMASFPFEFKYKIKNEHLMLLYHITEKLCEEEMEKLPEYDFIRSGGKPSGLVKKDLKWMAYYILSLTENEIRFLNDRKALIEKGEA